MSIREDLAEQNPDAVLWDGLDAALIGIAHRCGQPALAVYDYQLCVEAFEQEGMTYEEAVEWLDFNVVGAWVGPNTPVMLVRPEP